MVVIGAMQAAPGGWPPGAGEMAAGLQELRECSKQALREEPSGRPAARAKVCS